MFFLIKERPSGPSVLDQAGSWWHWGLDFDRVLPDPVSKVGREHNTTWKNLTQHQLLQLLLLRCLHWFTEWFTLKITLIYSTSIDIDSDFRGATGCDCDLSPEAPLCRVTRKSVVEVQSSRPGVNLRIKYSKRLQFHDCKQTRFSPKSKPASLRHHCSLLH